MKEKKIFIGILIGAILIIGAIVYRSSHQVVVQEMPSVDGVQEVLQATTSVQQNSSTTPVGTTSAKNTPVIPVQSPVNANKPGQVTVYYTAAGFSPKSVTIKRGTTVVFKNEGVSAMRVASAPHPAHTDYPGFDSSGPVHSGQSYSFIFGQIGTWQYHDHFNSVQQGSITVTQ